MKSQKVLKAVEKERPKHPDILLLRDDIKSPGLVNICSLTLMSWIFTVMLSLSLVWGGGFTTNI